MPETMSTERVVLLRHLGAEVVLTPGILMGDAVNRATQLVDKIPGSLMLDQFRNPANPEVHRRSTAEEIWRDTQGAVDVFVAGVGTGGTITGVGEVLKRRKRAVRVVAVEPATAAVLSGQPAGQHRIPGIGVGFIPEVLNRSILDEVVAVTDEDAFACTRRLAQEEGILAGPSSGAALHAALALASRADAEGKVIVVLLPDAGERYITTSLFADRQASKASPGSDENAGGRVRVNDTRRRRGWTGARRWPRRMPLTAGCTRRWSAADWPACSSPACWSASAPSRARVRSTSTSSRGLHASGGGITGFALLALYNIIAFIVPLLVLLGAISNRRVLGQHGRWNRSNSPWVKAGLALAVIAMSLGLLVSL